MMISPDEVTIEAGALGRLGHGVCLVDAERRVAGWNTRLDQMGVAADSVLGRPMAEVFGPLLVEHALLPSLENAARLSAKGGKPLVVRNVRLRFPAAKELRFNVFASQSVSHPGLAVLVFEDLTDALKAREQFDRILESTPDGIFVIDAERKVRLFNKACGEITGRHPQEILSSGCTCEGVVRCHTEEGESYATSLCPAKSVFGGEAAHQREEMLLTNAAGEERWVETSYSAVYGPDGRVEYVIGVLRDVHERKLLEDRLHQTEKLASFGQLVAGIAHEIKNPLAIIQSSLDVIENASRPESQKREAMQFIREEVRRVDDRLRSFLAFARPRDLRPQSIVPSGLLRRRLSALQTLFPGIIFHLEVPSPEPLVLADEEQLNQVLTNLVLNAGEALGGRGEVWLRARQGTNAVILEVEDNGPGIPDEFRARIFDPFFTTKTEGTGLGLSICYQIVLAHKGSISVAPGKHGGSCFSVRIPNSSRVAVA